MAGTTTSGRTMRKSAKRQFHKTRLCPSVESGEPCEKGAQCRFAHSYDELRQAPDLSKTRMCEEFKLNGTCPSGDKCSFAHDANELRGTATCFKTKICRFWLRDECTKGDQCRHAHGDQELRANPAEAKEAGVEEAAPEPEEVMVFRAPPGLEKPGPRVVSLESMVSSTKEDSLTDGTTWDAASCEGSMEFSDVAEEAAAGAGMGFPEVLCFNGSLTRGRPVTARMVDAHVKQVQSWCSASGFELTADSEAADLFVSFWKWHGTGAQLNTALALALPVGDAPAVVQEMYCGPHRACRITGSGGLRASVLVNEETGVVCIEGRGVDALLLRSAASRVVREPMGAKLPDGMMVKQCL